MTDSERIDKAAQEFQKLKDELSRLTLLLDAVIEHQKLLHKLFHHNERRFQQVREYAIDMDRILQQLSAKNVDVNFPEFPI